jgi:PRC-barrel domain protein
MRATAIVVASALALLPGSALAQTSSSPGGATPNAAALPGAAPGTPGAPVAAPKPPAPNPLTMEDTSKIKGADVYGSDNKKIGTVSAVLMKPDTKTVDRLVVTFGGVLGVGAHHAAMPLDAFSWDADQGGFKIAKTTDDLKAMPEWKEPSASTAAVTKPTGAASPGTSAQ